MAKKAANETKDAEDRAKLAEFSAKGGVGLELPEAKAAVAAAQRLLLAQAKVSNVHLWAMADISGAGMNT